MYIILIFLGVSLESRGEYDKAAGLALFHGAPERAIKALGSARGRDHKEGSTHHPTLPWL